MKKLLISAAIAFAAIAAASAQTTAPATVYVNSAPQQWSYIEVTGSAEREVTPDEIYVRIVVSENTSRGRVSIDKLERDMIARLQSLGIDTDADLRLANMSSALKEFWLRANTTRTTSTYELKVGSGRVLAQVYDALQDVGITNINVVRLTHTRIKEYQNEVRIEAMQNARDIAASLAEAVDQKAGAAIHITDYQFYPSPRYDEIRVYGGTASKASYSDVGEMTPEMRNLTISHSVNAKFALE